LQYYGKLGLKCLWVVDNISFIGYGENLIIGDKRDDYNKPNNLKHYNDFPLDDGHSIIYNAKIGLN